MTDRPILFTGPMVKAILDGQKTQTRRLLNPQPYIDKNGNFCCSNRKGNISIWGQYVDGTPSTRKFIEFRLKIKLGDRLWVRETWSDVNWNGVPAVYYRADGCLHDLMEDPQFLDDQGAMNYNHPSIEKYLFATWAYDVCEMTFRPSIHMPRWASRITLEVTDVRVQRLQDINGEDAKAEGVESSLAASNKLGPRGSYKDNFRILWDSINNKGGKRWEDNPWVVTYSFRPIFKNIDEVN